MGGAGGIVVTGSRDVTAKVWSFVKGGEYACTATLTGHTGYLNAIAVLPSGLNILCLCFDNSVNVIRMMVALINSTILLWR